MADKSGKTDMERVGLFQEMEYVTVGDVYRSKPHVFNATASKGRQMLPGGSKENSALQHGYFEIKYNRIFEGEGYGDPVAIRRRFRNEMHKKDLAGRFLPASGPKMTCGLGTYYGTIGGPVSAFSPLRKTVSSPTRAPGRNFFTNPGKHGTGYGYANVTINPYPAHSTDPYTSAREKMVADAKQHKNLCKGGPFKLNLYPEEYFQPNPHRVDKPLPPTRTTKPAPKVDYKPFKPSSPGKMSGGGKFGTFDPYPSHSADVYTNKSPPLKNVMNSSGKQYGPPQGPKTRPANSIMAQHVMRSMNIKNYRTWTPIS